MRVADVSEARGQFAKLLDEAEVGEEIVIARNGRPIVKLVPVTPPGRVLGRYADRVPAVTDEAWSASDAAVAARFAEAAG
jgi:prevent-host-death family protein